MTTVLKGSGGGGKTWRSLDLTQHQQPQQLSSNFLTIQTQPHNSGSSPHSSHSNLHSPIAASSTGLLTINCNIPMPHSPSSSSSCSHHMLTPNTISNLSQIGGSTQPSPSYYYQSSAQTQQAQHLAQTSSSRSEFKNRRSSSEPVQDILVHSSIVSSTLQQSHEDSNQQQPHFHPHQIVSHNSHPIECLDAALKVRNSQDRQAKMLMPVGSYWLNCCPPLTLFSRLIRSQLPFLLLSSTGHGASAIHPPLDDSHLPPTTTIDHYFSKMTHFISNGHLTDDFIILIPAAVRDFSLSPLC